MGVKGFNDNFFHRQQLIWLCNSLLQQCNDVMLMCYLSTITKGANSLNEVSWKISLDYVTSCSICQFLGIYWKSRCQEQKKKKHFAEKLPCIIHRNFFMPWNSFYCQIFPANIKKPCHIETASHWQKSKHF